MSDNGKCEHDGCNCAVTDDESFCSDHCKEAVDQDILEIKCDCGHTSCA